MKTRIRQITARFACTGLLLALCHMALADILDGAAPEREVTVGDPTTTVDGTARPVLTVDGTASTPGTETVDGTAGTVNPILTVDGTARSVERTPTVVPASIETVDGTANHALSFAQPIETVDGTASADGGDCWRVETVDGTAAIIDTPQGGDCGQDTPGAE